MANGSELRAKIRIDAETKAATAEIITLTKAQKELATGAAEAGRAASTMAPGIDAAGTASTSAAAAIIAQAQAAADLSSAIGIVRAAINPMVAELDAIERTMRDFSAAEEMGAISSREAALAIDQLAREANRIIATMEAAGVSIDGTTAAMGRQDTAIQQLINASSGITGATGDTVAEQLRHGMALDDLRARYNPLFAASRQYEVELHNIAEAERLGAISANEASAARDRAAAALAPIPGQLRQVGAATQQTTHYAGQLTYQLNDIGMMMAMGQNPFMLMIQQGPQVSQVLNDMRGRGLSLGPAIAGAFTQMVNPIALVTMGIIGASAVAVQYFGSAGAAADDLQDDIDGLGTAIDDYADAARAALAPTDELIEKYGSAAGAAREALQAIAAREQFEAITQLNKVLEQYQRGINAPARGVGAAGATRMADQYGVDADDIRAFVSLRRELELTDQAAVDATIALDALASARSLDDQLAAMTAFKAALDGSLPAYDEMDDAQRAVYDGVVDSIEAMSRLVGATSEATGEASALASQMDAVRDAIDGVTSAIASLGISNIGKTAQLAALRAGQSRADAVVAGKVAEERAKLAPAFGSDDAAIRLGAGNKLSAYEAQLRQGAALDSSIAGELESRKPTRSSGGGGRGKSRQSETDEIARLIAAEKEELAILREADPVKQELLRHSEAMAKATPAQRSELEALIRAQIDERETLEEIRQAQDEVGAAGGSAFSGLISGANGLSGALAGVLDKLAEMAASSAWDMLWGSGGGSLGLGDMFGGWLSSLGGKADGGRIAGSGGPRQDNILTWTSSGEYVVNAQATAQNLALIEAINAGARPADLLATLLGSSPQALALGGMVGASAPAGWFSGGSGSTGISGGLPTATRDGKLRVEFVPVLDRSGNLTAHIQSVAREQAEGVVVEGLTSFSAEVLPSRVSEINDNPRLRGR